MSTAVHNIQRGLRGWLVIAAFTACVFGAPGEARAQDPILEWNDIARQLAVVPAQSPVQQTRLMAIVHVAVHDAVNAVTGQYERYGPAGSSVPGGLSPEAAAIGAAYQALKGLFGPSAFLTTKFTESIATYGLLASDAGIAFGASVADRILQLRQNDGSATASYPYVPPDVGEIGVWDPGTAAALLPGWGNVAPFVLRSGSQFRPDPPPALDSARYARDHNEVLALGAAASVARTPEQTQIAQFWRASPTALWNPILRQALASRQFDLSETARVMALFYLAASDASVACWEAKYVYNFWRPQAAIARGDEDGNDATVGDSSWRPLVATPPHPDYVSAHGANSGAMAFVLRSIFGDAPGFVIEARSSQTPDFVRYWETFSQGVDEVIDARVYSGIHFRTADVVGARLGRQVAQFVLTHALRRVKGS